MAEDIYFDASHKFRQPRKFKKSGYKPKGKEYKFIDPAQGLIQQVETKIVKPKRGARVKRDMVDVDKKMVELLEQRRRIRKGREVQQTVDPDELQRIKALQERAIVPSTKMEMERVAKEKAEADKAQEEADKQAQQLLEEGKHTELIDSLKNLYDKPAALPVVNTLPDSAPIDVYDNNLSMLNQTVPYGRIRDDFIQWMGQNGINLNAYNNDPQELLLNKRRQVGVDARNRPLYETDDRYKIRVNRATRLYNRYRGATGKGLFGGKLANMHPMLAGSLIAHDYIHRHSNKILASLPAKHKGIKELEELKKNAKRAVVMCNKMHGKGFGDFFKKMVNVGQSLKDVYNKIPDVIKKPFEEKAKEAGRQQVQKASLFLKDKFIKK